MDLFVPPQDIESEIATLGAILLENKAFTRVANLITRDDYYRNAHRLIFDAMTSLHGKQEPIDLITLSAVLKEAGTLEAAGGPVFIAGIADGIPTAANVVHYAKIVKERSTARAVLKYARNLQGQIEEGVELKEVISDMRRGVSEISISNTDIKVLDMKEAVADTFKHLEKLHGMKGALTGIPSGIERLDKHTSGHQDGQLIIMAGRPGMGKCLGRGTKVLMYDGSLKQVEFINNGDKLMGVDSKPREVTGTTKGFDRMFLVKQNKGISYRVNSKHILSLKRSRNENKYKNGDILNIGLDEYIGKSKKFKTNYKGYKTSVNFKKKKYSIDPYFLGMWLGDGTKRNSGITTGDKEVIDYLYNYAKELNLQVTISEKKGSCSTYAITNGKKTPNKIKQSFSVKKMLGSLDLICNKHIPDNYLLNSEEVRLQLLAGLLDADGHYQKLGHIYEITQKDKSLLMQIKFLCDSLGFRTTVRSKKGSIKKLEFERTYIRLRITGDIHRIPVRISRKKAINKLLKRNWKATGIDVQYDKVDEYFGFELKGDGLFLLEDMTVTHNSVLAKDFGLNSGVPTALFSLEMSADSYVKRIFSDKANIDHDRTSTGNLTDSDFPKLAKVCGELIDTPFYLVDEGYMSLDQIIDTSERLKVEKDIKLIIIDYLQLIKARSAQGKSREQEVGEISRELKGLARRLSIPVIALSQLTRKVEERPDKRPIESDLRESGSLEQDADVIMLLYRPGKYFKDCDIKKIYKGWDNAPESLQGVAELIIAKGRDVKLGTVFIKEELRHQRFSDYYAKEKEWYA